MKYEFKTAGVCARRILLDVEDGKILAAQFEGGCQGNTKGIASLVVGMDVDDVIAKTKGIDCGGRGTSCPDQMAKALELIQNA